MVVQLVFMCALVVSACSFAYAQDTAAHPAITFNGAPLRTDLPVEARQGQLFLPLTQGVAFALGAALDVQIADNRLHAIVQWFGYQIEFIEGDPFVIVDGVRKPVPVASYADDSGVLLVPAADLFGAVDAEVTFDQAAMTLHVTRRIEAPDVVGQLPPELFTPPGQAPAAMTQEQLDEFMTSGGGLIYTMENSLGVEIDSVSGDKSQSYLHPRQIVLDRFTLRTEGTVAGNYAMVGYLRVNGSTDRDTKRGEIQKMNFTFDKPGLSIGVYDLLPRFSRYTMRNYRLQGLDVLIDKKSFQLQSVLGQSPKKFKDSEYQRLVSASRARWGSETRHAALNYIVTRDLGAHRRSDKLENRVATFSAEGEARDGWKLFGELATADTDFLKQNRSSSSTALQLQARRKTRNSSLDLSFESTGYDFYSETAYFTQGKHEWSVLWNARPTRRMAVGLGHRNRILKGSHTYIFPTLVSLAPLESRSKLKVDLRQNYERTTGATHSIVDNRKIDVRDQIGSAAVQLSLGRRKTKNNSGEVTLRASFDYKARFMITPRTLLMLEHNKEKRQNSATPLTRYHRARFTIEVSEWSDLNITLERYYNNSRNNRYGAIIGFRFMDVATDTEYLMDYAFMNYRDHNDQSLKMRYNIYR